MKVEREKRERELGLVEIEKGSGAKQWLGS